MFEAQPMNPPTYVIRLRPNPRIDARLGT